MWAFGFKRQDHEATDLSHERTCERLFGAVMARGVDGGARIMVSSRYPMTLTQN